MPPSLFPAVIRPALAEKNGRTIFIGTVRGRENHLWQTYQAAINDPDWYTDLLPASETGLIPEAELASPSNPWRGCGRVQPRTPLKGGKHMSITELILD